MDIDDPTVTDNDKATTALANEKNINGMTVENERGSTPRKSGNNTSANQAGMLNFKIVY